MRVAASKGVATNPYFGIGLQQGFGGSSISLSDVSGSGGNAKGSFDVYFQDSTKAIMPIADKVAPAMKPAEWLPPCSDMPPPVSLS